STPSPRALPLRRPSERAWPRLPRRRRPSPPSNRSTRAPDPGLATDDPDEPRLWASQERTVRDGKVAFPVPSSRTAGMQVLLDAPWEGHLGYRTTVVLRYAGEQAGDPMTPDEAVDRSRASSCFEGTSREKVVLPVEVHRVDVPGVHDEVPGTLAFTSTALPWLTPMARTVEGVLGSQDVRVCR
ncbi:MAG: hypothetical protein ACPF9W_04890, partial [Nocardioides sp.]